MFSKGGVDVKEELILQVYKYIHLGVFNKKGINGQLAGDISKKNGYDLEDIVQDLITKFLEDDEKGRIKNLDPVQDFVGVFIYRALLDLKKKFGRDERENQYVMEEYKDALM